MRSKDKQLRGIRLEEVLEKRRYEQALNAKEFAVLAGISYSTAREWFRLPGFPVLEGVVFWPDFVQWRQARHGLNRSRPERAAVKPSSSVAGELPAKAKDILAAG